LLQWDTRKDELLQKRWQEKLMSQANVTSGIGTWNRALRGLKIEAGKFTNLQETYGKNNVFPVYEGGKLDNALVKIGEPTENWNGWVLADPAPSMEQALKTYAGAMVTSLYPPLGGPLVGALAASREMRGDVADVSGEILETAPGAIATVGAAAAGVPAPAVAGIGAGVDALASTARQFASAQLPGREDITLGERVGMGIINVAGGLLGEGTGYVLGKGAKALAPSGRARLAKRVLKAQEGITPLSTEGRPVSEFLSESRAIEEQIERATGERVGLSMGQATGSPELLQLEAKLADLPESQLKVMTEQRGRLNRAENALTKTADMAAADPSALGKESVGARIALESDRFLDEAITARSTEVGPMFKEAEKQAGTKRLFQTDPMLQQLRVFEEGYALHPKIMGQLRRTSKSLNASATGTGRVDFKEIDKQLKYWSGIARGKTTPFENLAIAEQMRVARKMLDSIDASIAGMGGTLAPQVKAYGALRGARRAWAEYSKPINEFDTALTKKIFQLEGKLAEESVTGVFMRAPQKQVRGFIRSLGKRPSGKEAIRQLRAQVLQETFEEGGAAITKPLGVELTTHALTPTEMVGAIKRRSALIETLFADDPAGFNQTKAMLQIFDRLGQGPGFRIGKEVAFASPEVVRAVMQKGPLEFVGETAMSGAERARQFIGGKTGLIMTHEEAARALATPDGARAMFELAKIQALPPREVVTSRAARALVHFASILAREEFLAEPSWSGR
jgi:hypothetical protein